MNGATLVAILVSFTVVVAIGAKGCGPVDNHGPRPMKSAVQPASPK